MRPSPLLALAALACLCGAPAQGELWRWTDADGVVRYTPNPERVPVSGRTSLTRVEPGMARVAPVPRGAATPPLHAADELGFDPDPFNAPEQARTVRGASVPEPLEFEAAAPPGAEAPRAAQEAPAPETQPAPELPSATPVQASPAPRPVPLDPETLSRRDAILSQIAQDEAALKDLISAGSGEGRAAELREIAERLPALQAELAEIERRAAGGSGTREP